MMITGSYVVSRSKGLFFWNSVGVELQAYKKYPYITFTHTSADHLATAAF